MRGWLGSARALEEIWAEAPLGSTDIQRIADMPHQDRGQVCLWLANEGREGGGDVVVRVRVALEDGSGGGGHRRVYSMDKPL